MASMLSKRLGKRSLMGARVCIPSAVGDGTLMSGHYPTLQAVLGGEPPLVSCEDGYCKECPEEGSRVPECQALNRSKLYPGQKVFVIHCGHECAAFVEQHNHVDDEVKVFIPEQELYVSRKIEDVRLEAQKPPFEKSLSMVSTDSAEAATRSVSRSIDVPKRRSDAVEMDEMMAAMVLTSLSCSPLLQSPPCTDISMPAPQAACDLWKESGDVSDSGSSTTSGHWSGSSSMSAHSPPHPEASPKYSSEAAQVDEGFETDLDSLILDEPAPRKRKNSMKAMYKCLWPSCGKLLRSIVGIKRHVKTQHLGDGMDTDQHKREEDFYYTEVQMKDEAEAETVRSPSSVTPMMSVIQQTLVKPEMLPLDLLSTEPPLSSALSQSAPGSFWHIQADHAYQALPSIQIPVSPHIFTSISWAASPPSIPSLSPIRSRSFSFSDHQPQTAALQSQLIVASPPRAHSGTRKVRGEAKKCRKVYGIEHRNQWCTACRWKKACQRFLD
ncbi:zinc finger protein 395 [Ambystoma mexicanum]|uniref:zinc finger protein 395 n=1 Tax=Ambystoma mexicanum TaxID=8296 RepID=UPI0037E8DC8D